LRQNIKLLQNYPIQDVNVVLQLAYKNFDRPLRLHITPEQIQQRQEYLKKKYQQQHPQSTKASEVTNQIKNSINTLETKLQSLDFSKMFNQVSEKFTSIASPVTPDKSLFYFDNEEVEEQKKAEIASSKAKFDLDSLKLVHQKTIEEAEGYMGMQTTKFGTMISDLKSDMH